MILSIMDRRLFLYFSALCMIAITTATDDDPKETENIECKQDGFLPHPTNCRAYYWCSLRRRVRAIILECEEDEIFDTQSQKCTYPNLSTRQECGGTKLVADRIIRSPQPNGCIKEEFIGDENDSRIFYRCVEKGRGQFARYKFLCKPGTIWDSDTSSCNPLEDRLRKIRAPQIRNQPDGCTKEEFIGDENDCTKFYRCVNNGGGQFARYDFNCSPGTVWDSDISSCNHKWAVKSKCGTGSPPQNYPPKGEYEQPINPYPLYPQQLPQGMQNPEYIVNMPINIPPQYQQPQNPIQSNKPEEGKDNPNPVYVQPPQSMPSSSPTYPELQQSSSASSVIDNEINSTPIKCKAEGFVADPNDCRKFYRCVGHGKDFYLKYRFTCGPNTIWDPEINNCNHAWAVRKNNCLYKTDETSEKPSIPAESQLGNNGSTVENSKEPTAINSPIPPKENSPATPTESSSALPPEENSPATPSTESSKNNSSVTEEPNTLTVSTEIDGLITSVSIEKITYECTKDGYIPDKKDCQKFYRCYKLHQRGGFVKQEFRCGPGTVWDPDVNTCNFPRDTRNKCGKAESGSSENNASNSGQAESGSSENNASNSGQAESGSSENNATSPGQAESGSSENVANSSTNGKPSIITSGSSSVESTDKENQTEKFPPYVHTESTVSIAEETSKSPELNYNTTSSIVRYDNCSSHGEFIADSKDCKKFYRCVAHGDGYTKHQFTCNTDTVWDPIVKTCNFPRAVKSNCRNVDASESAQSSSSSTDSGSSSQPGNNTPQLSTESSSELHEVTEASSQVTESTSTEASSHVTESTSTVTSSSESENKENTPQLWTESSSDLSQVTSSTEASSQVTESTSTEASAQVTESTSTETSSSESENKENTPQLWTESSSDLSQVTSSTEASSQVTESTSTEASSQVSESTSTETSSNESENKENTPQLWTESSSDLSQVTSSTEASSPGPPEPSPATESTSTKQPTSSEQGPTSESSPKMNKCTQEGFFPNIGNCGQFYRCVPNEQGGYRKFEFDCAGGTIWDPDLNICNHPYAVRNKKCEQGLQQPKGQCTSAGYHASSEDCKNFYRCVDFGSGQYVKYNFTCMNNTIWDPNTLTCNHPWATINKACGHRGDNIPPETSETKTEPAPATTVQEIVATTISSGQNEVTDKEVTEGGTIDSSSIEPSISTDSATSTDSSSSESSGFTNPALTSTDSSYSESSSFTNSAPTESSISTDSSSSESSGFTNPAPTETSTSTDSSYSESSGVTNPALTESPTSTDSSYSESSASTNSAPTESSISTTDSSSSESSGVTNPAPTESPTSTDSSYSESSSFTNSAPTESSISTDSSSSESSGVTNPAPTESPTSTDSSYSESSAFTNSQPTEPSTSTDSSSTESSPSTDSSFSESSTYTNSVPTSTDSSSTESSTSTDSSFSESSTYTNSVPTESSASTDSSSSESFTSTDSSATESPSSANQTAMCPISQLEGDQMALVCPTGFKRHPKYCNLFYQCTTNPDTFEINILVISCPGRRIYDDSRIQCLPPDESDQECTGQIAEREQLRRLGNSVQPIEMQKEEPLCPSEGTFPLNTTDCNNHFIKCEKFNNSRAIRGYMYQCPENYTYWPVSRKCERFKPALPCDANLRQEYIWQIPVENEEEEDPTSKIDVRIKH